MLKLAMAKEYLSGIYNRHVSNQPAQLHRLARTIKNYAVLAVSNKQAGQSVFSYNMAQINLHHLVV